MLPPAQSPIKPPWLPIRLADCSQRDLLLAITLVALAIRLYLVVTSFCIAADGVAYIAMARDFASGEPGKALASVFSPLYPWLIAQAHRLVPDWELAGSLLSAAFGTATIPLLYLLIAEVLERNDIALGAAALAAIHPLMAEYSASVRTEAGFICLMVAAAYLFVVSLGSRRPATLVWAGLLGGVAYLYRTEAIGLLVVCLGFPLLGAIAWKKWTVSTAVGWALSFTLPFLLIASPYLIYLRVSTGHWTVGRELSAAMGFGMAEVVENKRSWQTSGLEGSTSILAPLLASPRAYLSKVGYDLVMSLYAFPIALGPLLSLFLIIGLWVRGRGIVSNWRESFLAVLVSFYFAGFVLSYTGTRFMFHLIPYTLGWVMIGLQACAERAAHPRWPQRWRMPQSIFAMLVAVTLLASTLIPIGYDLRGLRYAGQAIAARDSSAPGIVARDVRVAFYAHGQFVELPAHPAPDLCGWLAKESAARYLVVSRREEQGLGDLHSLQCVNLLKRYPRSRGSYYDLFQIVRD
ncbi:MAG TPA: glycosyltransferase family 39 protein [Candidatus Binataceae bacterium]|nr:glycosyltransferase family 39 protein [Candidatus Binataceae bacterium]